MQIKNFSLLLAIIVGLLYLSCGTEAQRPIGVHFDVEPASLPGGAVGNAPAFLTLIRRLKEITNGRTQLSWDIPMGMGRSWRYQNRPLSEWVLDIVDVVTLMSYRDHAAGSDGIIEHARGFLNYAERVGKKVITGTETACYPDLIDKVTYCEEGEAVLERELNIAYDTLSAEFGDAYGGLAVHDDQWYQAIAERTNGNIPHRRCRAMWAWEYDNVDDLAVQRRLINFMASHNVCVIYQDSEGFITSANGRAKLRTFINNCWARGIGVELLFGNAQWTYTQNHNRALNLARLSVDFFDTFPDASAPSTTARSTTARSTTARTTTGVATTGATFVSPPSVSLGGLVGVHVDVDVARFTGGISRNTERFFGLMQSLRTATRGFEFSMTIPAAYSNATFQDERFSDAFVDLADHTVVKVKSDTADVILDRSSFYLNYVGNRRNSKKISVALDTECGVADRFTFCEEGEVELETATDRTVNAFAARYNNSFAGVAINDYSAYFMLSMNSGVTVSANTPCRSLYVRSSEVVLSNSAQRTLLSFAESKRVCKMYLDAGSLLRSSSNRTRLRNFIGFLSGNGIDVSLMISEESMQALQSSVGRMMTYFRYFQSSAGVNSFGVVGQEESEELSGDPNPAGMIIGIPVAVAVVASVAVVAGVLIYRRRKSMKQTVEEPAQDPHQVEITTGEQIEMTSTNSN